jgi:hypothetical protein
LAFCEARERGSELDFADVGESRWTGALEGKDESEEEFIFHLHPCFPPRPFSIAMWHRYFMSGLAAAQYLSYLLVGALYFFVFGAMTGVAVSASLVGLGAVFVPLLLGGYASALSLIVPRAAAVVAFTCSVPYLVLGMLGMHVTVQTNSFFLIPSAVVIGVSIVAFLWSERSVWRRLTTTWAKILIGVCMTLPALFATWWLGSFVWGLLSSLHRAT